MIKDDVTGPLKDIEHKKNDVKYFEYNDLWIQIASAIAYNIGGTKNEVNLLIFQSIISPVIVIDSRNAKWPWDINNWKIMKAYPASNEVEMIAVEKEQTWELIWHAFWKIVIENKNHLILYLMKWEALSRCMKFSDRLNTN